MPQHEVWDLWFPDAAAQGLPFARGRLDATDVLLVHAAPASLRVEVRDDDGNRLAFADGLTRTADRPIARLTRTSGSVTRLDLWPEAEDIGRPVILPGGEVGILKAWWNADDGSEWRWTVELYNARGRRDVGT
ncbi:MAG TPA: hypothetical protein VEX37_03200 [Thermomicrobiales bacterium]|nr:hypothetical protein [Thermomicrobiales bacterium]